MHINEKFDLTKVSEKFQLINGFVSKDYYTSDSGYTEPPVGPIPTHFRCLYCKKSGNENHDVHCKRPLASSLILMEKTNEYPSAEIGENYISVVVKRGQKKAASKSARSELFYNSLEVYYEYPDGRTTLVRLPSNGNITVHFAAYNDNDIADTFLATLNKSLHTNYVYDLKQKYLLTSQFNLYPEEQKEQYYVNLNLIDITITRYSRIKRGDEYFLTDGENFYEIKDYNYNSGENYSKLGQLTNPYIQFNLLSEYAKINVMVYNRGAVQLKASNISDDGSLEFSYLKDAYEFLKKIFNIPDLLIQTDVKEKLSKIPNMVRTQPEKCHDRDGKNPGEGSYRPVPYSFYGVCPTEGYYVPPRGTLRKDNLYEPCCRKLKKTNKDSEERYRNILIYGYPDELAKKYGESIPRLGDSAVYIPGTKTVEPRAFAGLISYSKKELIDLIEEYGYMR
jgi:hypothetical protein